MSAPLRFVLRQSEGNYWSVEGDFGTTDVLCWGEMIEQVIGLTHPQLGKPRYPPTGTWDELSKLRHENRQLKEKLSASEPVDES